MARAQDGPVCLECVLRPRLAEERAQTTRRAAYDDAAQSSTRTSPALAASAHCFPFKPFLACQGHSLGSRLFSRRWRGRTASTRHGGENGSASSGGFDGESRDANGSQHDYASAGKRPEDTSSFGENGDGCIVAEGGGGCDGCRRTCEYDRARPACRDCADGLGSGYGGVGGSAKGRCSVTACALRSPLSLRLLLRVTTAALSTSVFTCLLSLRDCPRAYVLVRFGTARSSVEALCCHDRPTVLSRLYEIS